MPVRREISCSAEGPPKSTATFLSRHFRSISPPVFGSISPSVFQPPAPNPQSLSPLPYQTDLRLEPHLALFPHYLVDLLHQLSHLGCARLAGVHDKIGVLLGHPRPPPA